MEVQYDNHELIYIYLDRRRRRRKFLVSTFLRAVYSESNRDILNAIYGVEKADVKKLAKSDNIENLRLVEDIVDTGETLTQFLKELATFEPASVTIVAFLVKPDALQGRIEVDYVGYNIPNKFVIGYGLDYNGAGRNLSGINQLSDES